MDVTESSVVARKLRNFYVTQHTRPRVEETFDLETSDEKAGIFRQALMVSLMGFAVLLTEASLILIKWVRKLEESA